MAPVLRDRAHDVRVPLDPVGQWITKEILKVLYKFVVLGVVTLTTVGGSGAEIGWSEIVVLGVVTLPAGVDVGDAADGVVAAAVAGVLEVCIILTVIHKIKIVVVVEIGLADAAPGLDRCVSTRLNNLIIGFIEANPQLQSAGRRATRAIARRGRREGLKWGHDLLLHVGGSGGLIVVG